MTTRKPILLSPPHLNGSEAELVLEAIRSNWIAPLGPQVEAFEQEFGALTASGAALALSSGTAAIHLALLEAGVQPGDEVLVSTLTFIGSVNPILYAGAKPVFVDSELRSWNIDPDLVEQFLKGRAKRGRLPRALVVVHLYGQTADLDALSAICDRYGVALIEDAAEALGATYRGRPAGSIGVMGVFSFNGNKIVTTSGGGILVSDDVERLRHARKLATQAREPVDHYEHVEVGFNYRMSNLLAALGRAQLRDLPQRVAARRHNYEFYHRRLSALPGFTMMPEAPWGTHSRWLSTLTVDPTMGVDVDRIRRALAADSIEARPLWKPMHLQPVFRGAEAVGGSIAERLFRTGLCLPSGSSLSDADLDRVCSVIESVASGERVERDAPAAAPTEGLPVGGARG